MDRYTARMTALGTTQRERNVKMLKRDILNKTVDNPSYKAIKLNGVDTHLVINTGTQPYYKEFESLPDQEINIGDYVEWANSHWIVVVCDSDDEIYKDGKLNQCNYLLKWQNEKGEIIERWAVISSASKYNDGTDSNNVITLGSDQLSVVIPLDEEAIKLKKDMSKKFFIDNNKEDPTTYELTGTGNVPDTYNGHGVTSWIVKECAYTASADDLLYGVCDYHTPTTPSTPTTPPEDADETTDLFYMKISTSTYSIRPNNKKITLTAQLYDGDDNAITEDVTYEWTVNSTVIDYLTHANTDNKLIISLSDECEDFGEEINITCMSAYTGQSETITLITKEVF